MEEGVQLHQRTSLHRWHLKKMGIGSVVWHVAEYRGADFRKILHESKSLRDKKKMKELSD